MKPFDCFLVVTYVTNFAVGLLGNTLVIIYLCDALKRNHKFNKSLSSILLNLAAADILTEIFGTISLLFEYDIILHPEGALGDVVCKVFTSHTLTWTFTNVSVLTVVLLAWERYRAVTEFKSKVASGEGDANYIRYILAAFWFVGAAMYSPFIPFQVYDSNNGCHENFPNNAAKYGIPLMDILFFFVAPSIFFVYAYTRIVLALKKPPKDMSERRQRQFSYGKVRRKLTLTAMLIVGGFFACWSSAYMIYTVQVIGDIESASVDTAYQIAIIFAYFASTSHPIIYSFRSRHFRNKIKELFREVQLDSFLALVTSCCPTRTVEPANLYAVRQTEKTEIENPENVPRGEQFMPHAKTNQLIDSSTE